MRRKVQPEKVHASRGWCKQAGEHLNGRGFARTIRPEETEELAGGNLEVDAVNGGEVPESAGQPLRANGYFGHSVSVERSGLPRWKTLTRVARGLARMPSKAGPFKRVCADRSEEHTSELQSRLHLVCRLLLEKKNMIILLLHFLILMLVSLLVL